MTGREGNTCRVSPSLVSSSVLEIEELVSRVRQSGPEAAITYPLYFCG